MLIVTTETVPSKKITKIIGLVSSASVQTKNVFSDFGAGMKSLVGGSLKGYEKMLYAAKQEALQRIIADAENLGANAIIGFRYAGTNTTAVGSADLVAYGTAVVIE